MNYKPLDIDELKSLVDKYKENSMPCGVVFKVSLRAEVIRKMPYRTPGSTNFNQLFSIPIYFDDDQQEDCIVFEDSDLLYTYLNRQSDPYSWAKALVRHIPNQLTLDDLAPIIPTRPINPPDSR